VQPRRRGGCVVGVRDTARHLISAAGHAQRNRVADQPQGNPEATARHAHPSDGDSGMVAEKMSVLVQIVNEVPRHTMRFDKSGAIVAELENQLRISNLSQHNAIRSFQ
jgi:hypothetical protein